MRWHPIHESMFTSGGSDGSVMFWQVRYSNEYIQRTQAHERFCQARNAEKYIECKSHMPGGCRQGGGGGRDCARVDSLVSCLASCWTHTHHRQQWSHCQVLEQVPVFSEKNRTLVGVFRNRPGDSMRDKYNLNTLPPGHEEEYGNLGECLF